LSTGHITGEPRVGVAPSTYGPAMAALSEKRQAFVLNLFQGAKTYTEAYQAAGFGKPTSSGRTIKNNASRLACDAKIQAAVHEVGKHFIGAGAAIAYRQAMYVLAHPEHRDFGRIVGLFIDRAWPLETKTSATIDIHHDITVAAKQAEMEELVTRFAAEWGIDPARLLGRSRGAPRPMKVIEHAPAVHETTPDSRPSCKENVDGEA
jgi:hypothetical protein